MPVVALRTLREQRRALVMWAVGLAAFVGMYAGLYPSMAKGSTYSDLVDRMPESLRALFVATGAGDLTTGAGYLSVEVLSFMGPLLVILYAVGSGASAVAGEEERHTLDLVLAHPVSRTRLVLEKAAAMAGGLALLGAVLTGATVGMGALTGMGLWTEGVVATMTHLVLLGLVFGTLALLVGSLTGRLGPSRGVPALVGVVAYLVNGLGTTIGWLEPARPLSPFYQYIGHDPLHTGFSLPAVAVALGTSAVLVAASAVALRRRDVRG